MKTKIINKTKSKQSQLGFTLVEILVSATIGIFLIGGVITNFVSTQKIDKTRSAISDMDSNARSAINILRQTISHAGYGSNKSYLIEKPFFSAMDGVQDNQACTSTTNMNADSGGGSYTPGERQFSRDQGTKGDVLTVVHLADNPCMDGSASCSGSMNINPNALVFTDCLGGGATRDNRAVSCSVDNMPDPRDAKIYSTFFLERYDGEYALYCQGNRGGKEPLVENIKNMQFLYGVKQDDGNTRYYDAKQVESNNRWGNVVSVRVGLLVQSSEENIVSVNSDTKNKYVLLNKKITVSDSDLTRMYRVYTTTINLPNLDSGALL